jgi:hypothetical protein
VTKHFHWVRLCSLGTKAIVTPSIFIEFASVV